MPLDAALGIAKSLVKQKLSGPSAQFVDLAERLYGRYTSRIGDDQAPARKPGPRHWLNAARGRPDPMVNIYWYCDLPGLNGGPSTLPWQYVEEATLPYVEFEQVSNYRAGKNYHYPNHHNINTLQLKLYEDNRGSSIQYIKEWQSLLINRDTHLYQTPSKYKKPISITILDTAQQTVMFYYYFGCWPQSVDNSVFSSGQTERIAPTVTFSVDDMVMKFGKYDSGQVPSIIDNISKDFPASLPRLPSVFPQVFTDFTAKLFR